MKNSGKRGKEGKPDDHGRVFAERSGVFLGDSMKGEGDFLWIPQKCGCFIDNPGSHR